jgi:CheY-like chemotaxis protein
MTRLSVLVADDEDDIRTLVRGWLELAGHDVTCAATGTEGSALAKGKTFDLVVTDILMPEGDGVGLIGELKKLQPAARVLAISGGGRIIDGTDCLRIAQGLGAHAAVMKPFNREQFLAAMTQALASPAVSEERRG